MDLPPIGFLDVPTLLERSRPQARIPWFWYSAGAWLLVIVLTTLASGSSPQWNGAVELVSVLAMIGLMGSLPLSTMLTVKELRAEQQQIQGAAELVQLRCWPQAGLLLDQFLSRPTRSPQHRTQALIFLAAVLARYHRFEDAIAVQTYLIEDEQVDPGTSVGLRMGRAMAMLREDHLFDADRAISELRRQGGADSAGLALVEMYRDVKTGHPVDALEMFARKLPLLREQLGSRVADAHALAARAHDLLDHADEAQAAWHNATLLTPVAELIRRYPEVAKVATKFKPAPAPPEAV